MRSEKSRTWEILQTDNTILPTTPQLQGRQKVMQRINAGDLIPRRQEKENAGKMGVETMNGTRGKPRATGGRRLRRAPTGAARSQTTGRRPRASSSRPPARPGSRAPSSLRARSPRPLLGRDVRGSPGGRGGTQTGAAPAALGVSLGSRPAREARGPGLSGSFPPLGPRPRHLHKRRFRAGHATAQVSTGSCGCSKTTQATWQL